MKNIIAEVCYADDIYAEAQKWNIRFAKWFGGCKKVFAYNRETLSKDFLEKNKRFFNYKRGGGYWVWKSYIITESLKKLNYGDYLFYCDSGALIVRPIKKLMKVLERDGQDIMLFEVNGHNDKTWTKRDIFVALDCDKEEFASTTQRMGTYILIKKTEKSEEFFREYAEYVQRDMLITDEPNECGLPNYEGFRENRHDQSVLSLLSKKWGIKAYRDPSQWGDYQKILYKYKAYKYPGEYETYKRSTYPTVIMLHRYKELNLHNILAHFYHYWKNYFKILKEAKAQVNGNS